MEIMLTGKDFFLKWKDRNVLRFNVDTETVEVLERDLLPFSLGAMEENYQMVVKFCADRVLQLNRLHCKEILTSCGMEDQTNINICLVSKGLSFRDCYWICSCSSQDTWSSVNLRENEFSTDISKIALTGEPMLVDDSIYTGELTGKGTKAKGNFRIGKNIVLVKNESKKEIRVEVASYFIASAIRLRACKYARKVFFGKECSVCLIDSGGELELIPCRNVLSRFGCAFKAGTEYYDYFVKVGVGNFIRMQVFDYLTLNSDRNRDNFGLLRKNGKITGMYPAFDHDSCFKARSERGFYFVSGMSFADTMKLLKTQYSKIWNRIDFDRASQVLREDKNGVLAENLKPKEIQGMLERLEALNRI